MARQLVASTLSAGTSLDYTTLSPSRTFCRSASASFGSIFRFDGWRRGWPYGPVGTRPAYLNALRLLLGFAAPALEQPTDFSGSFPMLFD